jgi:glycosyltransferase involved in cell wall biosynthesis
MEQDRAIAEHILSAQRTADHGNAQQFRSAETAGTPAPSHSAVQSSSPDSQWTVTCVGFWLPCGRFNFFDIEDIELRGLEQGEDHEEGKPRLEGSVFNRLYHVLKGTRDYIEVARLIPSEREGRPDRSYPDAAIFAHPSTPTVDLILPCKFDKDWPEQPPGASAPHHDYGPQWLPGVEVEGVVLLVTAEGFYLWLALHNAAVASTSEVCRALKEHVQSIVGRDYYSHYSGNEGDRSYANVEEWPESLKHYEQDHLGILNFLQLNTLLEGLHSSTFDPQIFFHERSTEFNNEYIKKHYMLGRFIDLIAVQFDFVMTNVPDDEHRVPERHTADPEAHAPEDQRSLTDKVTSVIQSILKTPHSALQDAQQLRRLVVTDQVRQDVLRGFLIATADGSLKKLKWRIERCRRTLLGKMLEITNRRQPILQAETPGWDTEQIRSENEDQLRGYIMLISAKLPIVKNVSRYLEEVISVISHPTRNTTSLFRSWSMLLIAIEDNLHELEHAIEQARLDRLVYEEEQIRREQETSAELDRVRGLFSSGRGSSGGGRGKVPDIIGLIITLLGIYCTVALGLISIFLTYVSLQTDQEQHRLLNRLLELGPTLISIGFAVTVFFTLIAQKIMAMRQVQKERRRHQPEKVNYENYYEFDIHLDVGIDESDAAYLSEGRFAIAQERRAHEAPSYATAGRGATNPALEMETLELVWQKAETSRAQHVLGRVSNYMHEQVRIHRYRRWIDSDPDRMQLTQSPTRNSYRVDRLSDQESVYKVHVEAQIRWRVPCSPIRLWVLWDWLDRGPRLIGILHRFVIEPRYEKFTLSLIYELLFHQPSATQRYVLRNVRAIALHRRILSKAELKALKTLIVDECINVWISDERYRLKADHDHAAHDPLLMIHYIKPHIDTARFRADAKKRNEKRQWLIEQGFIDGSDAFLWVTVGAFAKHSDYPTLLKAFAHVVKRNADRRQKIYLLVLGHGPQRDIVEWHIEHKPLEHHVHILDWKKSWDVPTLLQVADGYISAERWEGIPVELFEALATECLFAATAWRRVKELDKLKDFGEVAPPADARRLAEAMQKIIDMPENERQQRGCEARAWVEQHKDLRLASTQKA